MDVMIKKTFLPLLVALSLFSLFAFAASALSDSLIGNVRPYRISDSSLIIYYDLISDSAQTVSLSLATDGLKFEPESVLGDTGPGIPPGKNKRIVCTFSADTPPPENIVVTISTGAALASPDTKGDASIHAVRAGDRFELDGRLGESFWDEAVPAGDFIQMELVEGAPATERTEIRIASDDTNLYIGIICFDSEPDAIVHNEMRRDVDLDSDDNLMIVIDTFGSLRNGYFFTINPNGARYDGIFYGTESINPDWDGVWDAKAKVTNQGWTAEIVIPFKSLRFPRAEIQNWRINFKRLIRRKSEESLWQSWHRQDGIHQLAKAGWLNGLDSISTRRSLELTPYMLGGTEREGRGKNATDTSYGLDARYPITSDLTLDVTTHTDFAQVESDTERINLSRFSLFYPEKRDFFLAGSEIYDYDAGYFEKVYHSRRIGISDDRKQIPILAGANLSGRTGPYSVGLLNIQTDRSGGTPSTNYSVVRLKRDIFARSSIGFIATNLDNEDDHTNRVIGADMFYQTDKLFGDRNFGIRADISGSFNDGEHDKSMFGRVFIDYPNDFIDSFCELYHVGENFAPEMGFVTRTGIRRIRGKFRMYPRPKIPFVKRLVFMPFGWDYVSDMDGTMLERNVQFWPIGIFTTSNDMLLVTANMAYDRVGSDFAIADKAVITADEYEWTNYGLQFTSSPGRPVSLSVDATRGGFYGGDREMISPALTYKLNRFAAVSAEALYNDLSLNKEHFITREYGGRLFLNLSTRLTSTVFAQYNNETSEVNMNFRLHFMPNMGSDLYLVYNEIWDESRDFAPKYRTAILKLDYLIRL